MRNGHGTGHGGVIAALHDIAQWWCVYCLHGKKTLTAKLTVEYIQVVPLEKEVEIWTRVTKLSKNFAFTDSEIRDRLTHRILSKSSCVMIVVPEDRPKL